MKWGVRRYQPYPKGKYGKFLGQDRDEDIVIKKGTSAYRVQSQKDLVGKGQSYISFSKLDHAKYLGEASSGEGGVAVDLLIPSGDKNRNAYSVRLKLSNDLIIPSYQKTMDAFIKTVDEVGVKNIAKDFSSKETGKEFVKKYKHLKVDDMRDDAYVLFVSKFISDTKAKKIFFDTLQEQGYNALIDDWDARLGKDGYLESPVIVFDKTNLKKTGSVQLSDKDAEYFRDIYFGGNSRDTKTRDKWDKWVGSDKYRDLY